MSQWAFREVGGLLERFCMVNSMNTTKHKMVIKKYIKGTKHVSRNEKSLSWVFSEKKFYKDSPHFL